MTHPTPEELQALVMGLEVPDEPVLRRHLAGCSACARRLAREARLELELHALAASPDVVPGRRHRVQRLAVWIGAAACVSIVAFLVWSRIEKPPAAPPAAIAESPTLPGPASPGFVDLRALGPGSDVLPPTEACRDVQTSAGPLAAPDS